LLALRNKMRYELLTEQFRIDQYEFIYNEFQHSLDRIFSYIYNYTDVMYIEFINKSILYDYMKYHHKLKDIAFIEMIMDVKKFLFFLEGIKKIKNVPKLDLSVKNFSLWSKL
jgi:hypothetical protein